jgi:hypothetical protein
MIANRRDRYFPALHRVARRAICAELPAVNISVTVRAFLPDIRENEFHMALCALHFFVHPA